jgi:phosphoglycolate phosphatase-like HAD superfamily hydrolase
MIVFDLDGTLIDITRRWYALHERYARLYGLPVIEKDTYITLKKEGVPERDIFSAQSIDQEVLEDYKRDRIAHIEDDEFLAHDVLVPQCTEVLEAWRDIGEIQIVTNRRNKEACGKELERLGILPSISNIHFATDATRREVIRELNVHEEVACLISDSLDDYTIATELEIPVLTVGYGCRSLAHFKEHGVRNVVMESNDLITLASSYKK